MQASHQVVLDSVDHSLLNLLDQSETLHYVVVGYLVVVLVQEALAARVCVLRPKLSLNLRTFALQVAQFVPYIPLLQVKAVLKHLRLEIRIHHF